MAGTTQENETTLILQDRREWNLAPTIFSSDSFLREIDLWRRFLASNAKSPESEYYDIESGFKKMGVLEKAEGGQVFTYEGKFMGLPIVIPVVNKNLAGKNYTESVPWIPVKEVERDGWKFNVVNLPRGDSEGGYFANLMKKAPEGRITPLMSYWFNPSFSDIGSWYGKIGYSIRTTDNEKDEKFEATFTAHNIGKPGIDITEFRVDASRRRYSGKEMPGIEVRYDTHPLYGREHERGKFVVGRDVLEGDSFPVEVVSRIIGKQILGEVPRRDLLAATLFPNMNSEATNIDMKQTLENLVDVFRRNAPDELRGFQQIAFKRF